ncbi:hypothetical protein FRC10_003962 [Ceratobasidium sp. 414]|nr:hypothetical protein FRC10_003962 [Ceratobasidium sp. 414]
MPTPAITPSGSKPGTPSGGPQLLLKRQLAELKKHPVEGFSAGLVDDSNLLEWEVMIIGPPDTLYEGGFFKARLTFPEHAPGDDQYGFEQAGERWMPVHTVESILISVISLLSSDTPNTDSPANVDAAVEVRGDISAYRKKVRRLARRSAEEE